jgi:cytochrome o ubiquinol oxidase subunit IV
MVVDDGGAGFRQGIPGGYSPARFLLRPVLARPGHYLDWNIHGGLFDGNSEMSLAESGTELHRTDTAPGEQRLARAEITIAILLTITSFFVSHTTLVWQPSIPVALIVLAIAQMGVHLVFFFHITTGPDSVNNVLALAFGVLIVFLLLLGSLWIMANLNHNLASMDESMQMQLERAPKLPAVTARGVVAPAATESVNARVSGVIQALYCNVNMEVKAGQLCAKIDPRPYQIALDQSRAGLQASEVQLEKDKAKLALAKSALEHQEALAKRRAISRRVLDKSRKSFERAQAETERAEAKVAGLQAALRAAETSLGSTDIVLPFDGTVVSRNVELGQTVKAGSKTPLFVIAEDPTSIHIDTTISAKDSAGVRLGSKATFTVPAFPKRQFFGTVTQVRPSRQTNEPATTTEAVISAPNPDRLLKPGMPATIRIAIE